MREKKAFVGLFNRHASEAFPTIMGNFRECQRDFTFLGFPDLEKVMNVMKRPVYGKSLELKFIHKRF